MNDLHETLRNIYFRVQKDMMSEEGFIKQVEAVYKDAGYHRECPPKVTDATLYPLVWAKSNGYKTGKEWLNLFHKELPPLLSQVVGGDLQMTFGDAYELAARRAANLEDTSNADLDRDY